MPKKKENLSPEERLIKAVIPKEEEPYKLPDNWVWTRLGNIGIWGSGGTPSRKNPEFYLNGTIPWLKTGDLNNGIVTETEEYITEEAIKKSSAKIFEKNSIGIAMYGATIGKIGIFGKNMATNQACAVIKNFDEIENKFIFYFFRNVKEKLIEKGKGGAQPNISQDILKKFPFILAPQNEQKRIVEKLDSLFEKTGKIKEIIKEVKEKTSSRRESVLSKAFTGELTEKWRAENKTENAKELLLKINEEKLKNNPKVKIKDISEMFVNEDEIPYKVPENWVWTRLGDITTVLSGGTPSTSKEEYYKNGNISWITPKDLSNYKEKYIYKGAKNITEEGLKKSSAVLLPKDSVLMSSRAPIGYVVICKKEVSTNQGFKNFAPSISYIPEYLYHYLKKSKNYLESIATGTTFKELSGEKAKKIIFPLPPLEEQKEIVRILDKVFEEENKISELISLEEKVEILEKTILDKAFRGELGTGNSDDEPAIELLKRALEENK